MVLATWESKKQGDWEVKIGHALPTDNIVFFEKIVDDMLLQRGEGDKFILTLDAQYDQGSDSVIVSPMLYELSGEGAMQIPGILYAKELSVAEFLQHADRIR